MTHGKGLRDGATHPGRTAARLSRRSTIAVAAILLAACGNRTDSTSTAGAAGVPASISGATTYTPAPQSAPAPGPTRQVEVAAHAFAANSSGTDMPVLTTPPVATPARGTLVLVQALTQRAATLQAIRDNMGNTYRQIGPSQTYADGKAGSALFACSDTRGGAGQTWSLVKAAGHAADEASIYVVALTASGGIGAWSYSNTVPYGTRTPLTAATAGSIVVSFWGPSDYSGSARDPLNAYHAPPGWTPGGQNDNAFNQNSGAYAWIPVSEAGTVLDPQWSSRKSVKANGSMWLVEVRP